MTANEFARLAPWTWMHDSELTGLRDPTTRDKMLCSVLGRLGEVFGLLVVRRPAGRRWILNTILDADNPREPNDGDRAFDQDCLKVEFVRKSELEDQDRAVLAAGGFSVGSKRGSVWPTFRSLLPGCYPWYLSQEEAETLLFAIPRVASLAELCRDAPDLSLDLANGEVAFLPEDFDPAVRPLRADELDWQPEMAPPEPMPAPAVLDETSLEKLARLPQPPGLDLEVDLFYGPSPVSDGRRPYFPKAAMAVEPESGFVGGCKFGGPTDEKWAAILGEVIKGALTQLTARPESFRVQRRRVAQMLLPLAEKLGIRVCEGPELSALNEAREDLMRHLSEAGR
ncbi:MAG: hypothetical protein AB9869_06070 [Verrucomicrobiia bacterium]